MAIQDTWLMNLQALVLQEGHGDKRAGYRAIADMTGMSEEYIYQLAEGKPKSDGTPREVGKSAAKKIGKAYGEGRPENWFDLPSPAATEAEYLTETLRRYGAGPKLPTLNRAKSTDVGTPKSESNELVIPQYDTGGGMGNGKLLLEDQPGVIKSWHVDEEWVRLNVKSHTGINNLCIVTGFGPSMRPMFNPGDPLLVDRGVTTVDTDAVYFFRVGDSGYIKTLQRIPDLVGDGKIIRAKSKNADFDPFDILPNNPHFQVLGKVLTVWRSEQF